jgi:hyperosmotically inducible protein
MMVRFIAAALVVLAVAAPARAGDAGNQQLFRDVQRQVLRYVHFTIFDSVHAQVEDGIVTLSGRVTMPYKRDDLERRVKRVVGVRELRNQIQVLPASQMDDELRLGIARAIYSHPAFRQFASMVNPPIHVIVEHGRVTLDGVVLSEVDRMLARSIASSFLAFEVKNELKTEDEVKQELAAL